mgnify:CR=1 FL=1
MLESFDALPGRTTSTFRGMHTKRPWLAMVFAGAMLAPLTALAANPADGAPVLLAQANGAARPPSPAASAAADRIAGLERTVDGLRGEARANRELAAQLRERLTRAEEAGRWTLPLLFGVLFLTGKELLSRRVGVVAGVVHAAVEVVEVAPQRERRASDEADCEVVIHDGPFLRWLSVGRDASEPASLPCSDQPSFSTASRSERRPDRRPPH